MAALPFTWRVHCTDTTAKIVVMSFYSDVPTVLVNDSPESVGSVSNVGTDGQGSIYDSSGVEPNESGATLGIAMFTWTISVTGLSANSNHTISVTQNAVEQTGGFKTVLGEDDTDEFTIFYVNCDGRRTEGSDTGCWKYVYDTAQTDNVVTVIHQDDHGYPDGMSVLSSGELADSLGNTRFVSSAGLGQDAEVSYPYVVAYGAYMGLSDYVAEVPSGTTQRFHDQYRIWCNQNISMIVSPGDHELFNNPEETTVPAAHAAAAKLAFKGTVGATQTYINDANSLAIIERIGPVEFMLPDRISALPDNVQLFDPATQDRDGAYTSWLSADQIGDIQGAIDGASTFKFACMATGARHLMTKTDRLTAIGAGWNDTFLGAQQPLHEYTIDAAGTGSEFVDLFTGPNGIASKRTRSYEPVFAILHGDTHHWEKNYIHLNNDENRISMYTFTSGSVNGQKSQGLHTSIQEGSGANGVNILSLPDWQPRDKTAATITEFYSSCIRMDFSYTDKWSVRIRVVECANGTDLYETPITVIDEVLETGTENAPANLRFGWI